MTEHPPSGNRWEPTAPPYPAPTPAYVAPPARPRVERHELRTAGISAAVAASVVLVAAAGFAVGRETAPDRSAPTGQGSQSGQLGQNDQNRQFGQGGQDGQDGGQFGGPPGLQAPGS